MGKGYNNDPRKANYKKSKISREKTVVYSEEDQEFNDQRLASAQEKRLNERNANIAKAKAMSNAEEEEEKPKQPVQKEPKDYATATQIASDDE